MPPRWSLLLQSPQYASFWTKSFWHYVFPASPVVSQAPDPNYQIERDRHPVRERHNARTGWQTTPDAGGILKREYESYEEYVVHQQQKLDETLKAKGGFTPQQILLYRLTFFSRFRHLPALLPPQARILCLGARQGTEVEVLRDLGFANAIGLDLNPGPENRFVKKGDFMKLEEADDSIDLIYSNCVDHAFDLDAFFAEHARVLKPGGYVLYDLGISEQLGGGAFEAVSWGRPEDLVQRLLSLYGELVRSEREAQWLWVLLRGKRARSA